MGAYNPTEPVAQLIEQLEKGIVFDLAGGQTISDAMMVYKGITILAQTGIYNNEIREWRRQITDQKTWAKYKLFFKRSHRDQRRSATTARKGGYTAMLKNVYGEPPPLPEEHYEAIEDI